MYPNITQYIPNIPLEKQVVFVVIYHTFQDFLGRIRPHPIRRFLPRSQEIAGLKEGVLTVGFP